MDEKINGRYNDLEQVKQAVEENQNVLTLPMANLRDAHGKAKLGIHVLDGISKGLAGLGLGHFPKALPNSQHQSVRVYKLGSPIGDVIDAVLEPNGDSDELLRQKSAGDDAETLRQVRELVCR